MPRGRSLSELQRVLPTTPSMTKLVKSPLTHQTVKVRMNAYGKPLDFETARSTGCLIIVAMAG